MRIFLHEANPIPRRCSSKWLGRLLKESCMSGRLLAGCCSSDPLRWVDHMVVCDLVMANTFADLPAGSAGGRTVIRLTSRRLFMSTVTSDQRCCLNARVLVAAGTLEVRFPKLALGRASGVNKVACEQPNKQGNVLLLGCPVAGRGWPHLAAGALQRRSWKIELLARFPKKSGGRQLADLPGCC